MNTLVCELRNVSDYVVNRTRSERALPRIQIIKGYETETRDPAVILAGKILGEESAALRDKFLALAHAKAEKSLDLTSEVDNGLKCVQAVVPRWLWGKIQEAVRELRFFFIDLKNRSEENVQEFSYKFISVINQLRCRIGLRNLQLKDIEASLDNIPELKQVLESQDEFNERLSPEKRRSSFTRAVNAINYLEYGHSQIGLTRPYAMVKNIIEMTKIEADLYSCIDEITKIMS